MVDIAQLVEHRFVVPSVVGSIPIIHPNGLVPKWFKGALCKRVIRRFESYQDLKKKLV